MHTHHKILLRRGRAAPVNDKQITRGSDDIIRPGLTLHYKVGLKNAKLYQWSIVWKAGCQVSLHYTFFEYPSWASTHEHVHM